MAYKILVINPGSTSTKIAIFEDQKELFQENIVHSDEERKPFQHVAEEFDMRKETILKVLKAHGLDLSELSAVVGRGGQLTGIHAGGYLVTEDMKKRLVAPGTIEHASNLGAFIASAIANPLGIPAYIYDAVGSDEMAPIAKITGFPEILRASFCHVLNSKAIARKVAQNLGKTYEESNFIVVHMGGGSSISAHSHGRIIDVISADDGPFSSERSGSAPLNNIVDMCYSGKYTYYEMKKKVAGKGGLKALLGTSDCIEVEKRIANGDQRAKEVYEAHAYQLAKGIGELSPVFKGNLDAIILTGGVAHSKMLTGMITSYVSFLAPVIVMPGENEMGALALGALRILNGKETAEPYQE